MKKALFTIGLIGTAFLCFSQDAIVVEDDKYHIYGPNSTWGEYLKVGGNGRGTTGASVVSTNGNLHLDSKNGQAIYINHYSQAKTLLNTLGGFVGIGTYNPRALLSVSSTTPVFDMYDSDASTDSKSWQMGITPNVMHFSVRNDANSSGTDYLQVTRLANSISHVDFPNGTIGIGTTNPDSNAGLHMYQDRYTLYGPNSTWGAYLQVGGNGRANNVASVVSTNGNLHLDSKNGSGTYLNHYSTGNTYLNTQGGSVGIGTTSMGTHKLAVDGTVGAREIKVEATGWSDFVFEKGYDLRTLEEVEQHINEKGHLPEIPSEAQVTANGINLGEMDAKLLQKIEELTLYLIEQNKEIVEMKKEISTLKSK